MFASQTVPSKLEVPAFKLTYIHKLMICEVDICCKIHTVVITVCKKYKCLVGIYMILRLTWFTLAGSLTSIIKSKSSSSQRATVS